MPCAALGAAACYSFWRWVNRPSWAGTLATGLILGLAELTKMTLLVFYPVWVLLWFTQRRWRKADTPMRPDAHGGAKFLTLLLMSLYVLNLGYFFEGSFTPFGKFDFVSDSLTASPKVGRGNRFADTWLGALPIPLPKDYVLGADLQKRDFEHTETPSYLRGRFQIGGWWYFYLYALAVKAPLGTWALLIATALLRLTRTLPCESGGAGVLLLAPALAILAFVSSQSGFSQHSRYVLPVLPFAFIWIGQVARTLTLRFVKTGVGCCALLIWSVANSLACYPHSLSYFNELAGGPAGGSAHLLGSDLDWGQDLLYLKRWLDDHPEVRPLYLSLIHI